MGVHRKEKKLKRSDSTWKLIYPFNDGKRV